MAEEFTIPSKNTPPTSGDAAPAKKRGRPPGSKNKPKGVTDATLKEGLTSYVGMIGAGLTMFPATQADGLVIIKGGEAWVDSLMVLAKSDARVRRVLETAMTGGAWGGFIISTASIAVPIAANHGLVPQFVANLVGVDMGDEDEGDTPMASVTDIFVTPPTETAT